MEGGFLTGQLLIAMPGISDPRFDRTLILICAHDPQHAMGLALNHPVQGLTVPDLLERLEIKSTIKAPPDLVLVGGPVERERGFVLHTDDYQGEFSLQVGGGVGLTATREVLEREIRENVWLTCEPDEGLIFDDDYDTKWTRAVAKLGIDPTFLTGDAGRA
jgi:putative transcriptional regulator